jgi:hypothetical protein
MHIFCAVEPQDRPRGRAQGLTMPYPEKRALRRLQTRGMGIVRDLRS